MIVADSCVFASVVVKDEFYETCRALMGERRATLNLAYAEAANVLWKHVRMGRIPADEVERRSGLLKGLIDTSRVFRMEKFIIDAAKLAVKYKITVYDALFIALAIQLKARLTTTDRELYKKLKETDLEGFLQVVE